MHKYGGKAYYTKYVEHLRKCHGINCFVKKGESRWQQFAKIDGGAAVKLALSEKVYKLCTIFVFFIGL